MSDESDTKDEKWKAKWTSPPEIKQSEDGHVLHPGVDRWLVSDGTKFRPTKNQDRFKRLAIRLAKRGKCFRGEWFRESHNPKWTGAPVTEDVWQTWVELGEPFMKWFFVGFPGMTEIGDVEFQMMDYQFWTGIRDGMSEGEEWAYRQYSKVRIEPNTKQKEDNEPQMREIRSYLGLSGGNAWRAETGEA
jgi:hypothetical protein